MILQQTYQCSRPFYELLASGELFNWLGCPYTIGGLGLAGFGMFIVLGGFIGLKNWSESWTLPLVWVALLVPTMSAALLPGSILRRLAGLLTIAFAMLLIGVYWWWGRS